MAEGFAGLALGACAAGVVAWAVMRQTAPARLSSQLRDVLAELGTLRADCAGLRAEWQKTLAQLDDLADVMDRRARRISAGVQKRDEREAADHESEKAKLAELTPAERRLWYRRHMRDGA